MTVRQATTEDEGALRSFLSGLCLEAQRLRFFTGAANLTQAAHLAAVVDDRHFGLIAHDQAGMVVGHGIFVLVDETRAEVAVEIADHLRGRGLGTVLVEELAAAAERRGVTRFIAEVLPDNRAMLDVFRDGFDARITLHNGTDAVEFPTASWRLAHERFAHEPMGRSRTGARAVDGPAGG